jgi:very-short-patch-repair endonuclease
VVKNKKNKKPMEAALHNQKYLKPIRRDLRNDGTAAEATLWRYLQNKKLGGRKFRTYIDQV